MDDLYHPELIEERKKILDAAAYEKNLNQDVNIPLIKIFFHKQQHQDFFPLFNQQRIIKIVHDGNKVFNKKFIYLLLFILIEVLFVNQMHIFLNMQFFDGVFYGYNCFVFFFMKIIVSI